MYLPQFLDLRVGFSKYFSAVPATTDALRDECFRIRHEVYCKELQYEPLRPDGRETDAYDAHSVYCLLRANESGRFIGCIRLDPAQPAGSGNAVSVREDLCGDDRPRARRPFEAGPEEGCRGLPPRRRFRVSPTPERSGYPRNDIAGGLRLPRAPALPVCPSRAVPRHDLPGTAHGIDTLFVLTEPRLARHLSLLGVHIKRIGGPVEHRGRRVPSMLSVPGIVGGFGPFVRPLYEQIDGEVAEGYAGKQSVLTEAPVTTSVAAPPWGAPVAT